MWNSILLLDSVSLYRAREQSKDLLKSPRTASPRLPSSAPARLIDNMDSKQAVLDGDFAASFINTNINRAYVPQTSAHLLCT